MSLQQQYNITSVYTYNLRHIDNEVSAYWCLQTVNRVINVLIEPLASQ